MRLALLVLLSTKMTPITNGRDPIFSSTRFAYETIAIKQAEVGVPMRVKNARLEWERGMLEMHAPRELMVML